MNRATRAASAAVVVVDLAAVRRALRVQLCSVPVAASRPLCPSFHAEIARCTARHASVPRRAGVLAGVKVVAGVAEAAAVVAAVEAVVVAAEVGTRADFLLA